MKKLWYILGSIGLAIGAFVLMPKIIEACSSFLYQKSPRKVDNSDDWGPEIVKKKVEENRDGSV